MHIQDIVKVVGFVDVAVLEPFGNTGLSGPYSPRVPSLGNLQEAPFRKRFVEIIKDSPCRVDRSGCPEPLVVAANAFGNAERAAGDAHAAAPLIFGELTRIKVIAAGSADAGTPIGHVQVELRVDDKMTSKSRPDWPWRRGSKGLND